MGSRDIIAWLMWKTGFSELFRILLGKNGRVVLLFHGISDHKHTDILPGLQPPLTKSNFQDILSWLCIRYVFLTPREFFESDKPGVLLTFDDGFSNNYTHALPILEKYGAPAIFFVSTQHVNNPHNWLQASRLLAQKGWGSEESVPKNIAMDMYNGMSESQLIECASHPLITIGSHTISHPFLTHCSNDELETEIAGSKMLLENITGNIIDLFAYPSGDYNHRVAQIVQKAGYRAAFAVDPLNIALPLFEIPRIGLYASSAPYLSLKLSGLHRPFIRQVKGGNAAKDRWE